MATTGTPTYRLLRESDIKGAQKLRTLAQWNQSDEDWCNFLKFEPQGCFAAEMDGQLVGTATTIRYEPAKGPGSFGWVGMVLVHPDYRRHGIGSSLLKKSIAYLKEVGVETIKLDATPMGRPVYEKLGFAAEYNLERWEGECIGPMRLPLEANCNVSSCSVNDIERIVEFDRPIFGARRRAVIDAWVRAWPEQAAVVRAGSRVAGYALARRGTNFQQIGPIVGSTPGISHALLAHMLKQLTGKKVIVDLVTANGWVSRVAASCGLSQQRPYLRMALGPNTAKCQLDKVMAICCPELG